MQHSRYDVLIVGGGAAGFFTAINLAEARPELRIAILERGKEVLQKVRISGGGRCNATHACWEPRELTQYYPRGEKELLGPFHKFCTGDTVDWFETRGVALKIEEDGRMFPVTDSSQTIIDCFQTAVKQAGIQVLTSCNVTHIEAWEKGWKLSGPTQEWLAHKVVLAPGSSKQAWKMLEGLGHSIVEPVPSLFTFNCKDTRLRNRAGLSVANAQVQVLDTDLSAEGPLLVTHWGLSGPAILKLSAWGARKLHALNYKFRIQVNFTGLEAEAAQEQIQEALSTHELPPRNEHSTPTHMTVTMPRSFRKPNEAGVGYPLLYRPGSTWAKFMGGTAPNATTAAADSVCVERATASSSWRTGCGTNGTRGAASGTAGSIIGKVPTGEKTMNRSSAGDPRLL